MNPRSNNANDAGVRAEKLPWDDGDLLVVGSSRFAAPRRIFLGSTAARILAGVDVPVVVIPVVVIPVVVVPVVVVPKAE